jgi:hypothetical protein
MLESHAFAAVFLVQVLAMSVLHPAWFSRYARGKMEHYRSSERFAELYPGMAPATVQRALLRYRMVNGAIAVAGLLLLGWLYRYMQRPGWSDGAVKALTGAYFLVQMLPLIAVAIITARSNRSATRRATPEVKRKASLQRRGLFDFISPYTVGLAAVLYMLFCALAIHIARNPFPGFAGPGINIGIVTLGYLLQAAVIYARLYGRRTDPLETRAERGHWTGLIVKACVYSCIASVAFLSLDFVLALLDQQRWEPFAQSAFFTFCAFLCSIGLTLPPRTPDASPPGFTATH